MPLKAGYSSVTINANVHYLVKNGKPRTQAIAIALDLARKSYFKRYPKGALPAWLAPKSGKRMQNPVPPSKKVQIRDASALYSNFTGHEAEVIERLAKPEYPDVLCTIGTVDGIMYTTERDNVIEKYVHKFHKDAKPLFCVTPDGTGIFFIGGAYDFTERGIVDQTDPKQQE